MNDRRKKQASALIVELSGILAEIDLMKDEEASACTSILSVLEVEALTEAVSAVGEAIDALKGATA